MAKDSRLGYGQQQAPYALQMATALLGEDPVIRRPYEAPPQKLSAPSLSSTPLSPFAIGEQPTGDTSGAPPVAQLPAQAPGQPMEGNSLQQLSDHFLNSKPIEIARGPASQGNRPQEYAGFQRDAYDQMGDFADHLVQQNYSPDQVGAIKSHFQADQAANKTLSAILDQHGPDKDGVAQHLLEIYGKDPVGGRGLIEKYKELRRNSAPPAPNPSPWARQGDDPRGASPDLMQSVGGPKTSQPWIPDATLDKIRAKGTQFNIG